ncbi:MAG: histidine phosphatase family protein [Bacteroidota bacterium]
MRRLACLVTLLCALTLSAYGQATTVYLLRHAEKTEATMIRDVPLSEAGLARADAVARLLASAKVTAIHSTQYQRTQQTAAPLAAAYGLGVQPYDPSALDAFAEALRTSAGIHVVVGHSNTTPYLAAALGGAEVPPIPEDEYDRLYHIVLLDGEPVQTTLLRIPAGQPK